MQRSFESLAAYLNGSTVNVTVDGTPRRYTGAYVTDEFLRALGVQPALGRDFNAADNRAGAEKVALIGDGIWQRNFGGAQNIVGKAVRINGTPAVPGSARAVPVKADTKASAAHPPRATINPPFDGYKVRSSL